MYGVTVAFTVAIEQQGYFLYVCKENDI